MNTVKMSILISAMSCSTALAQNSDVGFLMGAAAPTKEIVGSSNVRVTTALGTSGQINYAWQVKSTRAGDLYVETPLVIIGHNNVNITSTVGEFNNSAILLAPGLRFKVSVHSRVSLYVAGGAGAGWIKNTETRFESGDVIRVSRGRTAGVVGFGGGMDFRLTRFVSLRGEARDFFTPTAATWSPSRNHVIFNFGLGLHF